MAVSGDEVEDCFPSAAVVVVEEEDSTRVKSSVWRVMPIESITEDSIMGISSPLLTQVSVEGRTSPIIAADRTNMGNPDVSWERILSNLLVFELMVVSILVSGSSSWEDAGSASGSVLR